MVSTRDFVNLRHWSVVEGVYVSAGGSVPDWDDARRTEATVLRQGTNHVRGRAGGCFFPRRASSGSFRR